MLNVVAITGRLTAAPEQKQTNSGVAVTKFTVAVDRNFKSGDTKQTDFIPCVAWRNTAEFIAKYFGKGDMIAVQGTLQSDKFTDKDGNNRTAYNVVVDNASFCGGKSGENKSNAATVQNGFAAIADDDLPFG